MKELIAGILVLMVSHGAMADGGVSFSRNRIIYPATERAVSLSVVNHGDTANLVQASVSATPDKRTSAPFVVTPPLFRLEGNSENTLRIMGSGDGLPADRESVFYFSGLVIPAGKAPGAGDDGKMSASLSVSMRSVMKIFYRPSGLKPAPDKAPDALRFVRTGKGLKVVNPTPYYQSFAELSIDGHAMNLDSGPSMVSPFSEQVFSSATPVKSVTWRVMNDYGGTTLVKTQPVTD